MLAKRISTKPSTNRNANVIKFIVYSMLAYIESPYMKAKNILKASLTDFNISDQKLYA